MIPATEQMPVAPTEPPLLARPRSWWWLAVGTAVTVAAIVVAFGRGDEPSADPPAITLGTAPTTTIPAATTTTPTTTTTTTAPTTTMPATTVPALPAASTIEDVLILLDTDADRFGVRADDLRRDLERIIEREGRGRDIERLRERVAEWTADGSLPGDAAAVVDAVLWSYQGGDDDD